MNVFFLFSSQIIIKAVGLPDIPHENEQGDELIFGPVFNETFLKTVFDLQERIKALGSGTEHSFDKICFAPLRSDGQTKTSVDECVVQSVWAYFGNDPENVDDSGEYLDTFYSCSQ